MNQNKKQKPAKVITIILFVALIICGLITLSGLLLEKTALNPAFYHKLTDDPALHEHIRGLLWQALTGQEEQPDDSAVYSAFRSAFDEQWLTDQLDLAVDRVLGFVMGNENSLIVDIDIKDRKGIFRQELLLLAGQSAPSRLAASLAGFLSAEVVPDELTLISLNATDLEPLLQQKLAALQRYRLWFKFVPYAAYGLLFILFLLWGGFSSGLKWSGLGLIVSGVLFVLVALLLFKSGAAQPYMENLAKFLTAQPVLVNKAIITAEGAAARMAAVQAAVGLLIYGAGFIMQLVNRKVAEKKGL